MAGLRPFLDIAGMTPITAALSGFLQCGNGDGMMTKVRSARHAGTFPVITGLDHVVVLASDIAAGSCRLPDAVRAAPSWRNSGDGADRVLFTLDNMTLELMAPRGDGATADRIRAVLAEQGEGLASLCFRTDDIAKMHRRLDRLTLKPEPVAEVESRDAITGATLSWKRTRAATDATRGVRLFFLELAKERPLSVPSARRTDHRDGSCGDLDRDPERAAALYGARLGLDMALDRSHPDWGRLMFFRCGDLIVEVMHRPGKREARQRQDRRQAARHVLARRRYRRHPGAAGGRRRRRLGSPHRPQAGHAGHDRAQRHLRRSDASGAAIGREGRRLGIDADGEHVVSQTAACVLRLIAVRSLSD